MITTGKLAKEIKIVADMCAYSEMDAVIIVDGHEGIGKSRMGRVLLHDFSELIGCSYGVGNIHFLIDDYIEAAEKGKPLQINIMDESREVLNLKRSMSRQNLRFCNWISECRRLRQIHIIILSAIHDLDRFIATHRMNLLINIVGFAYRDDDKYKLLRGVYNIYPPSSSLFDFILKKSKHGYYQYPKPAYSGEVKNIEPFTNKQLIDYEKKKAIKRKDKYSKDTDSSSSRIQRDNLIKYLATNLKRPKKEIAQQVGCTVRTVQRVCKE